MKFVVGLVLLVAGIAVCGYGIAQALTPVASMYQEALNDPMGTRRAGDVGDGGTNGAANGSVLDNASETVPSAMVRGLVIGAAGLPLVVVGSVLMKIVLFGQVRRALGGRH
jgi:hypothetical protein